MAEAKPRPKKRNCVQCGKPNAVVPARLCPTCKRLNKKASAEKRHDKYVVETYGVSPGDYKKLFDAQGGKCAICRGGSQKKLAVDHSHKTGLVRGLLCYRCNTDLLAQIGYDDPERLAFILKNAIQYLNDPPAQKILGKK